MNAEHREVEYTLDKQRGWTTVLEECFTWPTVDLEEQMQLFLTTGKQNPHFFHLDLEHLKKKKCLTYMTKIIKWIDK